MNIQRLKFAWARGARIEWKDPHADKFSSLWNVRPLPAWDEAQTYRIHPNDAHLEYGPLSRSLLRTSTSRFTDGLYHSTTGVAVCLFPELGEEWWDLSGEDRLMQFLFLAELLADEGL